jgi:hypothetical protein
MMNRSRRSADKSADRGLTFRGKTVEIRNDRNRSTAFRRELDLTLFVFR